jgi:hypothetical protein
VVSAPFPASEVGGCLREGSPDGHGRPAEWARTKLHLSPDKGVPSPIKVMRTQSDTRPIISSPTVATTARIHPTLSEQPRAALQPVAAGAGTDRRAPRDITATTSPFGLRGYAAAVRRRRPGHLRARISGHRIGPAPVAESRLWRISGRSARARLGWRSRISLGLADAEREIGRIPALDRGGQVGRAE